MKKTLNDDSTLEDELADFTDHVLSGDDKEDQERFTPDPELRALQQAVLRLKNNLPEDGPSEAVVRRMRQNIITQWTQPENLTSVPFWKRLLAPGKLLGQKWQSQASLRRKVLLRSLAAAFFLFLASIPLLYRETSLQPAASGHNLISGLFVGFSGLVLLAHWLFRRMR